MSKDIIGTTIVDGQLAIYGSTTGLQLMQIMEKTKQSEYPVVHVPPSPRKRKTISTELTDVLLLVLEPFLDQANTEPFEPSPGNIKNRVDMTGLPLKPGQILAHVVGLPRGGNVLQISQVVEYGPRGGAQVQAMRKYNGELVVVKSKQPKYVGDCLVLNENLKNRLIKYRLMRS